jgi:hypothetical protein
VVVRFSRQVRLLNFSQNYSIIQFYYIRDYILSYGFVQTSMRTFLFGKAFFFISWLTGIFLENLMSEGGKKINKKDSYSFF